MTKLKGFCAFLKMKCKRCDFQVDFSNIQSMEDDEFNRHIIDCMEVNNLYSSISNLQRFTWNLGYGGQRGDSFLSPNFNKEYLSSLREKSHLKIIEFGSKIEDKLLHMIIAQGGLIIFSLDGTYSHREVLFST